MLCRVFCVSLTCTLLAHAQHLSRPDKGYNNKVQYYGDYEHGLNCSPKRDCGLRSSTKAVLSGIAGSIAILYGLRGQIQLHPSLHSTALMRLRNTLQAYLSVFVSNFVFRPPEGGGGRLCVGPFTSLLGIMNYNKFKYTHSQLNELSILMAPQSKGIGAIYCSYACSYIGAGMDTARVLRCLPAARAS